MVMADSSPVTLHGLLLAAPRLDVQLILVFLQAVFWHVMIFRVLPPIVGGFINSMRTKEQFLALSAKTFKSMFKLDFKGDQALLFEFTVLFQVVMAQHFVGGLLCLPSVLDLPIVSPPMAAALARHGALCELGWEIQDFLVRIKEILFDGELGRKKNPASWMMVLVLHHTAAQFMVVPLNLYYGDNALYHEAVFLLQSAAAVAMVCQSFGFTLDVSRPRELLLMQLTVTFALAVAFWTRAWRYGYIFYELIATFIADGNSLVLNLSVFPLVGLTLVNLLILADFSKKFKKFVLDRALAQRGQGEWCRAYPSQHRPAPMVPTSEKKQY